MLYEGKVERKRFKKKMSRFFDEFDGEETEKKPEDMNQDENEFDEIPMDAILNPSTGFKDGSRDHTLDDPYVEGLENRLYKILEDYESKHIKTTDPTKGQGVLGGKAKDSVKRAGVEGHANPKVKPSTPQGAYRDENDEEYLRNHKKKEETEEDEPDELDAIKKELGMGDEA